MRQFNLYRRGKIYYVRFKDETTGKWSSGISTGESEENAALATVYGWDRDGIPTREKRTPDSIIETRRLIDKLKTADLSASDAGAIVDILKRRRLIETATLSGTDTARPFIEFLKEIWTYEGSPYVKRRKRLKRPIGKKHCYAMLNHVTKWWEPSDVFQVPDYDRDRSGEVKRPILLGEVTKAHIEAFADELDEQGLADASIAHIMNAGIAAFRFAIEQELIEIDPTRKYKRTSIQSAKREILTAAEIKRLFSGEWPDETAKLAALVALTTGCRAGEIVALRTDDIKDDRLIIRHSWSQHDGLKSTKTGKERQVPLLPYLRDQLRDRAAQNPNGEPWVFWSTSVVGRPMDPRVFPQGLSDALVLWELPRSELEASRRAVNAIYRKAKPDPDDQEALERVNEIRERWRKRGVTFHVFRHIFSSSLAERMDLRTVQLATGHATKEMAEHYADHATAEQFEQVANGARDAFGTILQFPGADVREAT